MPGPVLVVIDLQEAMRAEQAEGFAWANPDAASAAGRLVAGFRARGLPVLHVHHNEADPEGGFHPDNPLSRAMAEVAPAPDEPVVVKTTSSAFVGTGLEGLLRQAGPGPLVICGGEANMCVESTTRMARDLGFKTTLAADALVAFPRSLRNGQMMPAQAVLDMSLANLRGFARIADTADILAELP